MEHPRFNSNGYIVTAMGPYQLHEEDMRCFQGVVGMLTDRVGIKNIGGTLQLFLLSFNS